MQIAVPKTVFTEWKSINKLNYKYFIIYPFLQARAAPRPPLFFRIHVTQDDSPDKDLSLAGRPEWQTWKSVQGLWIALWEDFLIERNKEALRHPWCLEKSEGERHGQNIFRKCCFVYWMGFIFVILQWRQHSRIKLLLIKFLCHSTWDRTIRS